MTAFLHTEKIIEIYEVSEYRDEPVTLMWDEQLEGCLAADLEAA